jgi:hypothetical protein
MRIMASHTTSRLESVQLPDGQHTQSGEETLRELYRVHFCGLAVEEMTREGLGHPNLIDCAAHRED